MYVIDDIVYAGNCVDNIKIIEAKPLSNQMLLLTFSTGEERLFDATLLKGSAFKPLANEDVFKNIEVIHGYVSWNNGEIDCAPEFMYENSYKYAPDELRSIYA